MTAIAVHTASEASLSRFLTFRLGEELLALDMSSVREVLEFAGITRMPLAPPTLPGVINLRGAVVPVIDLAERLRRGSAQFARRTCVIIVEIEHEGASHRLGLIVDGVSEALEVGSAEVEPTPAFGTGIREDLLGGMLRRDGAFVMVLAPEKVFALDELGREVEEWHRQMAGNP